MLFYNKQAAAKALQVIIQLSEGSTLATISQGIAMLCLQLTLVFSIEASQIFIYSTNYQVLDGIMSASSLFNTLSETFNLTDHLRKSSPTFIIILISTICSIMLFIIFSICRADLVKTVFANYDISKRTIYVNFLGYLLIYYKPFFLAFNIISINMVFCESRY